MQYNHQEIEKKWQKFWAENQTFKASNSSEKPKYYVLDMFPYPSGAGLHVGHPLGYIASDIYARYKRHKGFNVLHPQGYDSFGLPAEQYAIQTGQHPAKTTEENIKTYRRQLDQIGFSFDWSREVRTSKPEYYKWTQWIFIELFNSWYNKDTDKAEDISTLEKIFKKDGNIPEISGVNAVCDENIQSFSAKQWKAFSTKEQQQILVQYRLTFLSDTEVNWCPALGTVLANDEIVNGVSERGGHPVIRKKMTQWSMRISAYAQRLLDGLEKIDWPQPLKDSQTNWIGRSQGAMVSFEILSPTLSKGKGSNEESKTPGYMIGGNNSFLLLEKAKEMRANPTPAEAILWKQLKGKKTKLKFRQQHLINDYIVDFVCLTRKLIIEVDGKIHDYQLEKDEERTLELEQKSGFKVIRFKNEEVIGNIDEVLIKIDKELNNQFYNLQKLEEKVLQSKAQIDQNTTIISEKNQHTTPTVSLSSGKGVRDRISVFTTRPDTIFGVSFMTLAPEHELVSKITTDAQKAAVKAYIETTSKRSERDRMADVKTISGVFTGAFAAHPFTKKPIPIWIGDYVLAGYGTGAVMAVPCGDQRDYDFAKHFGIEIPNIFENIDISEAAHTDKEGTVIANSGFLSGLVYKKALKLAISELEKQGFGYEKINYRLRDAVFSRQRYWGEPFPVYYKNGMPQMIDAKHLPIVLPEVEKYLPTEDGKPPLGNAEVWAWDSKKYSVVSNLLIDNETVFPLELNTMPGWAGSSWYFNRYMDANNPKEFASKEALNYWQDVDLYIGGSEHATGHLLYARFWQKFLFDKGIVPVDEFAKKLINQGMILGTSAFVFKATTFVKNGCDIDKSNDDVIEKIPTVFVSRNLFTSDDEFETVVKEYLLDKKLLNPNFADLVMITKTPLHADVSFVNASDELDIEAFKNWRNEFKDASFISEKNGTFKVSREVEKMSKSKYNVVNPDDIVVEYGADALRMFEMFLGPLEQTKPWKTSGISGVYSFLKKLWKLYFNEDIFEVSEEKATKDEFKILHKTIKKVAEDIENFSFNTSVSTFMIAVNELTALKCNKREILEPLLVLLSSYAPHITEELWRLLGNKESISTAPFPIFDAKYLVESVKNYPISFNGKTRFTLELSLDLSKEEIEKAVLENEKTIAQLEGKTPKQIIIVPGKIVNIVG
jgi:leucyl-tRNA synthetase